VLLAKHDRQRQVHWQLGIHGLDARSLWKHF